MESKILQIQEISKTELREIIREELSNLQANPSKEIPSPDNDLLTRKQVLELLNISPVTLWKHQKSGKIPVYGLSKNRYYKRSEIMECLTQLKK